MKNLDKFIGFIKKRLIGEHCSHISNFIIDYYPAEDTKWLSHGTFETSLCDVKLVCRHCEHVYLGRDYIFRDVLTKEVIEPKIKD